MSWATCYSGSNNIHHASPPMMSDGRNYASWEPDAAANEKMKMNANIKTNWDYRNYLQTHASEIMKHNSVESCYALGTSVKPVLTDKKNGAPFMFDGSFDQKTPVFGYEESDLKNVYLSREQLYARSVAPSINTKNF
jgi:hypothetical protein